MPASPLECQHMPYLAEQVHRQQLPALVPICRRETQPPLRRHQHRQPYRPLVHPCRAVVLTHRFHGLRFVQPAPSRSEKGLRAHLTTPDRLLFMPTPPQGLSPRLQWLRKLSPTLVGPMAAAVQAAQVAEVARRAAAAVMEDLAVSVLEAVKQHCRKRFAL